MPNKSLEPTAVGAVSSAVAVYVVSRRCPAVAGFLREGRGNAIGILRIRSPAADSLVNPSVFGW